MIIQFLGDYYSAIASTTTSLINRPLNIDGTEILNTSFKMAVIQLNPSENRIIQIITPANINESILIFRTSVLGNFENSKWVIINPSNTLQITQNDVADYITTNYDLTINNAHITKKNGIVELTLDITVNENIPYFTVLFEMSKNILNVLGSYQFVAMGTTDEFVNVSYYPCYIRSSGHTNTEIITRKTIPSGINLVLSFTCNSI